MLDQRIEDNILIATFNNGTFNTITRETVEHLGDAVKKVNDDDSIKGMILTGEGRTFSAGFDLPMFLGFKNLDEVVEFFEKLAEPVFKEFFMCKKPVVSALNGATMAGGMILAAASDYRVCKNHPKIQIGMSEIKIGLGLSVVQTEIIRFGLGGDKAYERVMFSGERYSVDQALELGMVDELAEEENLLPRAKEIVAGWWDNPGHAFSMLKKSLRQPYADRMDHYLEKSNWQEGFNIMFDPATRKTLEVVHSMMK